MISALRKSALLLVIGQGSASLPGVMKSLLSSLLLCLSFSAPAIAPAAEAPAPPLVVKALYAAHASEKSPFFQSDDRALIDRFFTATLGDLLVKDVVESEGQVGRLAFDPLFASQDPQITEFVIGETRLGGEGKAIVPVTFKDGGMARKISFHVVQGKDKVWLIEDIHYPDLENLFLKEMLSEVE